MHVHLKTEITVMRAAEFVNSRLFSAFRALKTAISPIQRNCA